MDEINRSDLNTGRKTPRIGMWIAIALIITLMVTMLALYFPRFLEQDARYETVLGNTAKVVEITSRMRINLLKSTDLKKDAVMAITDEESQVFAKLSRESADAVERDYQKLKGLIDAAKIDKEMKLLKEFSDNWNHLRLIDRELLSLAVENTNIKAANLSYTAAAQAIANFERLLSELMDIPTSDGERAQTAKLAYQTATAVFIIYSLEAPHINEAQDKKMDELETIMGTNEKKVRSALRNLSRLTDQHGGIILNDALLAFSKFMEVHKEVLRLSRMNTNIKSLELSLGRKRKVAAQCEEILNSLQDTVQDRSFKATQ
ncbi:MAG: hypothetical protein NT047_10370 [Deltaproteobacteria bacterium]|nr:hypothetical protein [Deltaproteobacteria bacterium]